MADDGTLIALVAIAALGLAGAARRGSGALIRGGGGALAPMNVAVVGTLGDVNPLQYGGGVIFVRRKTLSSPTGQSPWIEFVGESRGEDEDEDSNRTVYRVDIPSDVAEAYDWIDWAQLARYPGTTEDELIEQARSRDVSTRARLIELIGDYYGWRSLDDHPMELTGRELEERWGLTEA